MRLLLAAAVTVMLIACSTASAELAPLNLNADQAPFPAIGQKALAAAQAYWGTNPCPAGVRELPASRETIGGAMASGGCVIFWDHTVSPSVPLDWCTTVVHEYGHLIGYRHTEDPWSAMYGGPRILKLSGPFKAESSSQGFCYGRGFYRTWKPVGVLAP